MLLVLCLEDAAHRLIYFFQYPHILVIFAWALQQRSASYMGSKSHMIYSFIKTSKTIVLLHLDKETSQWDLPENISLFYPIIANFKHSLFMILDNTREAFILFLFLGKLNF